MIVCLSDVGEGLLLSLFHPSLLLPVSPIPFITLPFSSTRPNQIKEAVLRRRVKDRSEESWIFHRHHFIKILLQWNFATSEALTTTSLRRDGSWLGPPKDIAQNNNIHAFTSSVGPSGDCFQLKQDFLNFNTSTLNSRIYIVIRKYLGFVKRGPSNNRASSRLITLDNWHLSIIIIIMSLYLHIKVDWGVLWSIRHYRKKSS